jgi:hypothetical protein
VCSSDLHHNQTSSKMDEPLPFSSFMEYFMTIIMI